MNWFAQLLRRVPRRGFRRRRVQFAIRPRLEVLDSRITPTVSSLTANLNGTVVRPSADLWFSSVLSASGLSADPVTIHVDHAVISTASFNLSLADAVITFAPGASTATTTYTPGDAVWTTTAPSGLPGSTFISGGRMTLPPGKPTPVNPVTWTANFTTDTPGVTVSWKWAVAAFNQLGSDYSALGIKPVDSSTGSQYTNTDPAGTPENFKRFVTGVPRGAGSFTGSYTAAALVAPDVVAPPPTSTTASLSGTVFLDADNNGLQDAGENGVAGVTLTLTGTDVNGNTVSLTTTTDAYGHFSFTGLKAGTYQLAKQPVSGQFADLNAKAGTVNGSTVGTVVDNNTIVGITLGATDSGSNYTFGEIRFA